MKITNIEETYPISFRIDHGFNSAGEISDMVNSLFELDEASFIILGVIAENGPLNARQIEKKGFEKSYEITRDKVRSRLPGTLKDYLIKNEGEIFRNTGKREKFYHLTFKGSIRRKLYYKKISRISFKICKQIFHSRNNYPVNQIQYCIIFGKKCN